MMVFLKILNEKNVCRDGGAAACCQQHGAKDGDANGGEGKDYNNRDGCKPTSNKFPKSGIDFSKIIARSTFLT